MKRPYLSFFSHPDCDCRFWNFTKSKQKALADFDRRPGISPCPEEPLFFFMSAAKHVFHGQRLLSIIIIYIICFMSTNFYISLIMHSTIFAALTAASMLNWPKSIPASPLALSEIERITTKGILLRWHV